MCVKIIIHYSNMYIKLDILNAILSKLKPTLVKISSHKNMYKFSDSDIQMLEYLNIHLQNNILIPESSGKIYKVDKLNVITHLDTNFFY